IAGNCAACHAPPWSIETIADRCMSCHKEVRDQLTGKRGLHGLMPAGKECRACHSEHRGAQAPLTHDLTNPTHFNHEWTDFKLTGKHRDVACASCHANSPFKGTPQTCVSCHGEPLSHKGKWGTRCADCHSTTTWHGAVYKHKFPVTHGREGNTCV